jgi:hypothetical protein
MTSKSMTLIFIALVVLASLAGADTPTNGVPETASPATAALTMPAAPAEASATCNPLLTTLGISPLDSAKNASDYPDCGVCSDFACQGLEIYSFCGGTPRQPKRCRTAGSMCLEDPRVKCLCVDWVTP